MTMLDLYPERLLASGETKGILAALSEAVGAAETAQEEFFRQFCIQTATYGLSWMEAYLGLPIGEGRPLGERRAAILGKLQGQGPATKAAVTELVRTFLGEGAGIEEKNTESRLLVRYRGEPSDAQKLHLLLALQNWIPAHINIAIIPLMREKSEISLISHTVICARKRYRITVNWPVERVQAGEFEIRQRLPAQSCTFYRIEVH